MGRAFQHSRAGQLSLGHVSFGEERLAKGAPRKNLKAREKLFLICASIEQVTSPLAKVHLITLAKLSGRVTVRIKGSICLPLPPHNMLEWPPRSLHPRSHHIIA
jgi:hypothetical protein